MKTSEYDAYVKFFSEFGGYIKEGAATDFANRDRLSDLLLVESTTTEPGKFTTLADYVGRMRSEQKDINYLVGESRDLIANSPYIEAYKARGEEVLLLTDPIDEYFVSSVGSYKDKRLKAVDRGASEPQDSDQHKAQEQKFKPLLEAMTKSLPAVQDVKLSSRLKESAAVLVAGEYALSAHMERLMRRMGRGDEIPESKRTLEINPEHPAVAAMLSLAEKDTSDTRLNDLTALLYDQALITEGSQVKDPAAFARRLGDLMTLMATKS
jgi:molecular chaperone HtpG